MLEIKRHCFYALSCVFYNRLNNCDPISKKSKIYTFPKNELYIAQQMNKNFQQNHEFSDASMNLGRNTNIGPLIRNSLLATSNFKMAANFQDGRQVII